MTLQKATGKTTDTWLTPPWIIDALGPFDTDPCCPPDMPWPTAKRMITEKENGLLTPWHGRVWLNPPYSAPLPWVEKFVRHHNGIALVGGRSPETRWCQMLTRFADLICYPSWRIVFYYPDGALADGAWQPNLLVSMGARATRKLERWGENNDCLLLERRYP